MSDVEIRLVLNTIKDNQPLMIKMLLELWNAERPHFGGVAPHRYDGRSNRCWYCSRPKKWAKVNALKQTDEILSILIGVK
jgi:hypothetical protein